MNPQDLRYSREHEWVRVEFEGVAVVGITEFATGSLGDVVFLDLPEVGTELSQSQKLGEIESVKAVSDLFAPVGGSVLERNEQAIDNPQLVNDGPYEGGWLLRVSLKDRGELDNLLSADEYDSFLESPDQ